MTAQATELDKAFDPKKLSAGLYVAVAGSDAYAVLLGMTEAGVATLEGTRFLPTGEKVITVRNGAGSPAGSRVSNSLGRIGIGREFFVTALKDYEDWREKWWREVVQNAVDAKARNVHCRVQEQPDGTFEASCEDDGMGMSEEVLLDKFLVLGGTTKLGAAGETGGFGKAKELLLLPWIGWKIRSGTVEVEGAGIEYKVERGLPNRKGVLLQVKMPADQTVRAPNARNFLGKCTIPGVHFTVDGEAVATNVRRGKLVETIAGKAEVYHNRSAERMGGMLIRINGIYMFNRWLDSSVAGTVFVELIGKSTDLLTANRDGIRDYELRRGLEAFGSRLAKDTTSALKGKRNLFTTRYRGSGLFEADGYDAREVAGAATAAAGGIRTSGSGKKEHVVVEDDQLQVISEVILKWGGDGAASASGDRVDLGVAPVSLISSFMSVVKGEVSYEHALLQLAWKPDFLVSNEDENFRVPKKFLPADMTPTVLKIAKVWSELCRFVLIQLGSKAQYGVGWVFSTSARATFQVHDDAKWLLLNPFKPKRGWSGGADYSELWNPNAEEDLRHLYAFAVHEATHLADGISYHDEAFSSALTMNMAKTVGGWKEAKKIAAGVKTRGAEKKLKAGEGVLAALSLDELESWRPDIEKMWRDMRDLLMERIHDLPDREYARMRAQRELFEDWLWRGGTEDPRPFLRWFEKEVATVAKRKS